MFTLGSRPGECPVLNPIPACAAVNGCVSDDICNLGERCCLQSNCTKKCVKVVVPRTPPMRPHGKYSQFKFFLSPQNKIKVKTMVNSWIHCLQNKISKIFSKFLFCWNGRLKKNSDCRTCTCQNTLPVTPISFSIKRRYLENVHFPNVVWRGMCVNIYFGSSLFYWLFCCLS